MCEKICDILLSNDLFKGLFVIGNMTLKDGIKEVSEEFENSGWMKWLCHQSIPVFILTFPCTFIAGFVFTMKYAKRLGSSVEKIYFN